ncbi:hypothetical protein PVIIG_06313 [Plasmodium vivax India VII]|uniref:PIR Superfamily Protein n=1 Tax=Plasmodium vivax India VII TaxID=1077284 RepID=A0A0J9S4Q1_PLAVI|nr:hypothetical protein PVIIG_06313 [Plasmodium vivax India VII]
MSLDNLNISQLRKEYPFLNEIWNLYDSFDKSVEGDSKPLYDSICELATENLDNDKTKYYDICMNIIRNLDPYCKKGETCMLYSDRCSNVNNWLYNIIEEKDFNKKHIIKRIFDLTKIIRPEINRNGCPYYSYDTEYKEPMNTIHLKIFTDNIDVIERTLKMHDKSKHNIHYQQLKVIILVVLHLKFQQQLAQWLEYLLYSHYYIRWINTGLRGNGGRINNILYSNGADDLILDGLEHNNFNSYNIGYEAA